MNLFFISHFSSVILTKLFCVSPFYLCNYCSIAIELDCVCLFVCNWYSAQILVNCVVSFRKLDYLDVRRWWPSWIRLVICLGLSRVFCLDFTSIATTTAAAAASFQCQSFGSSPPVGCIIRWDPLSRTSSADRQSHHLPDYPSTF